MQTTTSTIRIQSIDNDTNFYHTHHITNSIAGLKAHSTTQGYTYGVCECVCVSKCDIARGGGEWESKSTFRFPLYVENNATSNDNHFNLPQYHIISYPLVFIHATLE